MRCRALLVPVLLLSLAPLGSASACHGSTHHVETLAVSLPPSPEAVPAGSTTSVPVTVTRAGSPAAEVDVYLGLRYGPAPAAVSFGRGRTGADGRVVLRAAVPRSARDALHLGVEAFRPVVGIPCYGGVEEHGLTESPWGRAAR